MQKVFHASSSRGEANHGWLHAKHSFSFANYFNPDRIQFGALRVLNDDTIAPGMGFGTHPHNNMEIITIPLEGALEHKDSMDNVGIIEADEIQVMSAGTGVSHSEYNKNKDLAVSLLQIWILPKAQNVTPRYDQKNIKELKKVNELYPVVTPDPKADRHVDSPRRLVSYG
jgi:redox-sensitive bicupin YhaK (pirin superfamily)